MTKLKFATLLTLALPIIAFAQNQSWELCSQNMSATAHAEFSNPSVQRFHNVAKTIDKRQKEKLKAVEALVLKNEAFKNKILEIDNLQGNFVDKRHLLWDTIRDPQGPLTALAKFNDSNPHVKDKYESDIVWRHMDHKLHLVLCETEQTLKTVEEKFSINHIGISVCSSVDFKIGVKDGKSFIYSEYNQDPDLAHLFPINRYENGKQHKYTSVMDLDGVEFGLSEQAYVDKKVLKNCGSAPKSNKGLSVTQDERNSGKEVATYNPFGKPKSGAVKQ